tara:strand:- start:15 stop:476 length:462 start_codon:yes stop_codon:yes gene_type:complete
MKFLCISCDTVMDFVERQIPGDGTLAAVFECGSCNKEVAMLTNPMETQLVSSMGVKIGGREVPAQPMELSRTSMEGGKAEVFEVPESGLPEHQGHPLSVTWTPEAVGRLDNVPSFVRGMVKRIYTDWAQQNGISEMNPVIMDRARTELGLEGM